MDFRNWQAQLEPALCAALLRCLDALRGVPVARIDIGVFPWHGAIEISFLRSSDLASGLCEHDDVAAWPHYDFVNSREGKWPEAEALFKQMRTAWQQDLELAEQFYCAVADITRYHAVANVVRQFTKADQFILTLFDPDKRNKYNFCV